MKKAWTFLRISICSLCMLTALIFVCIEGWLLFSGDWKLFENDLLVVFQLCARLLAALLASATSLMAALQRKPSFLREGSCMLILSLASLPFISNQLGWSFVVLSVLFLLSDQTIYRFALSRCSPEPE